MDNQKKNYCKWGIAFALLWNILILGFYSITCLVEGVPFSENIEVDNWYAFYTCYALATAAWFYIGYALRKEYITEQTRFVSYVENKGKGDGNPKELFKFYFIRKYARILIPCFFIAIPWNIAFNLDGDWSTKDTVTVGIFTVGLIVSICVTKIMTKKIGD